MRNKVIVLTVGLLLISSVVIGDDVIIDGSGNITSGISAIDGNLEVTGSSGEDGIVGSTSGSGAAGVYGENTTSGNSGLLGDNNYGVYGNSSSGYAGFFQGNSRVTDNLTVGGNLTVDGNITATGLGDVTGVTAGTGMTGGGTSGDVTLNVDFSGTGSAGTASRSDHTHSGNDINGGTVAGAYIDSTIARDSEIMTTVLSSDGPGSTLDADTIDGIDSTGFAAASHTHPVSQYAAVAIVAQTGGDYTNPAYAMYGVATWCGTPSSSNPCLVRIMPGMYDLGSEGITMQPYVDIEGSGENTTIITTHLNNSSSGTVSGADNAEIRFLTLDNQGTGSGYSYAIYNSYASPKITNVTATASGGSHSHAVHNYESSPTMMNVTAAATGTDDNYAVMNSSSSPKMMNVTATASGGTSNDGVRNIYSSPIMTNVTSIVSGGTFSRAVYNQGSSPTMTHVTATASGGNSNYGIYNRSYSSPTLMNVTASASGGITSYGVYIYQSSPTLMNVTSSASAASVSNSGVYCNDSTVTMMNISASASGGTNSYGVYNLALSSSTIMSSRITGTTNSVNNSATIKIGSSMLDGPVSGSGFTCVGTYDASFAALGTGCL